MQVNDVNAVAFGEDEAAHLRVPTAGLVAEVHTRVQKLAHGTTAMMLPFCIFKSFGYGNRVGFAHTLATNTA